MIRNIPASAALPYRCWLPANSTDASFTARAMTATKPTTGVIELCPTNGTAPTYLALVPYGAGSDNTTFDVRIIGWRTVEDGATKTWMPTILYVFSCTLSAAVGVASAAVLATERFADTVSVTAGNANVDYTVVSPANDTPAHLVIDTKGCQLLQADFDMTGATSGNLLFAAF